MKIFYEYELDHADATVLIEGDDEDGDIVIPTSNSIGFPIIKAKEKFEKALSSVNAQAKKLYDCLEKVDADEVEVTFGLITTGEVGNFAISKVSVEANYEITLKWKKKNTSSSTSKDSQ